MTKLTALDFESDAIQERPDYPPRPVGISICVDGGSKDDTYLAWGHPVENNCTFDYAKRQITSVLDHSDVVFHNASFDASIIIEKFNLFPAPERIHDTMVQAFLLDPFGELSLKPLAEKHLGMPPTERDAVKDWLVAHAGVRASDKSWGAHISKAPGKLVGTYAIGDGARTLGLHNIFIPRIKETGMYDAYRREMALMPHIMAMERRGVNLDGPSLRSDTDYYFGKLDELDEEIQSMLGCRVDVDSNAQLADAIEAAGMSAGFATTPTGKRSTSKESLIGAIANPQLLGHLLVRGSIATCLRTFFQPWLEQYNKNERLFIRWNQIRNYSDTGARTGRLSSSPNLQNVPVVWEGLKTQLDKVGYKLQFELPSMRKYIIPDPGMVFIGRDYSGQELRLLAHFTQGKLLQALKSNPKEDLHQIAAKLANITRREAKTLAFAILYGAGVGRIAESLHMSIDEATRVKKRYLEALPEIKEFTGMVQNKGKSRDYVTTLGGRNYYAQKPAVVEGRFKSFEYKLVNYLIQGSAADQTKQAMLDYARTTKSGQMQLSVHDQLVIQCPAADVWRESEILAAAMNGSFQDILDYEIVSDEAIGHSFAELK